MHTQDTKNRFLDLRARGWSLDRIAERIHVSRSTLIMWNRELQWEIRTVRAMDREAIFEKIKASVDEDLAQIIAQRKKVQKEIARRKLDDVPTEKLYQLAALLRRQHEEVQDRTDRMEGRDLSIPLPVHPVVAAKVRLAEFKQQYGFPMVPPNPFDPPSKEAKPGAEKTNDISPDSSEEPKISESSELSTASEDDSVHPGP